MIDCTEKFYLCKRLAQVGCSLSGFMAQAGAALAFGRMCRRKVKLKIIMIWVTTRITRMSMRVETQ